MLTARIRSRLAHQGQATLLDGILKRKHAQSRRSGCAQKTSVGLTDFMV